MRTSLIAVSLAGFFTSCSAVYASGPNSNLTYDNYYRWFKIYSSGDAELPGLNDTLNAFWNAQSECGSNCHIDADVLPPCMSNEDTVFGEGDVLTKALNDLGSCMCNDEAFMHSRLSCLLEGVCLRHVIVHKK